MRPATLVHDRQPSQNLTTIYKTPNPKHDTRYPMAGGGGRMVHGPNSSLQYIKLDRVRSTSSKTHPYQIAFPPHPALLSPTDLIIIIWMDVVFYSQDLDYPVAVPRGG